MTPLLFDGNVGFCNGREYSIKQLIKKKGSSVHTNGFNQLPWENYFEPDKKQPEDEEEAEGEEEEAIKTDIKELKKLKKQQRKEVRLQKKMNAAKRKLTRLQKELSVKDSQPRDEEAEVNPYNIKRQIKQTYGNIMNLYGEGINSRTDFKLFQYKSIALYKSDLDFILPGEWLNDNNISFIYELILHLFIQNSDFSYEVQLLVPSLIQLFLHLPLNDDLPNILPVNDLKKLKFLFIPFNHMDDEGSINLEEANNGDHWMLCVLCLLNNKLYVFDSMAYTDEENDKSLEDLVKRLQFCKRIFQNGSNQPIEIVRMSCDQQDNSDDCGVYLIMISCLLIKRLFYGDKPDEEIENEEYTEELSHSRHTIDLDISDVKFNALDGRLYMIDLIYKLAEELKPN